VVVGVGEVLAVGEVLGVAVGEVLGVGVGEVLGVAVGEVLGQQWNRDAGRPIWPDAEILIQLMVWIGSSLWGSDQVFVHVESGWTTGRGMAERHNDVRAYDLKIHVGNLDGGTRTARRRGIIGPRSCHTRAGDGGRHSCHRDRPHCPSPQEHVLVLPCSGRIGQPN
jgi:hypothetical protein